jgi:hypothetical protein
MDDLTDEPNNPNASDLQLALWSLHLTIVHDARDWGASNRDARTYALVVGWDDDCWPDLQRKFGWTDETVRTLKKRHAAIRKARGGFPESMVER